jgi:defect-in-organelle-trafficking protein DotC
MTIRSPHHSKLLLGSILSLLLGFSSLSFAATLPVEENVSRSADPSDMSSLQERQKTTEDTRSGKKKDALAQEEDMAIRIRQESVKEAAFSYGARGGLAWRTHQIMLTLDENAPALDKTYNFRRLLISAPSNLLIEPPIITEALNAFVVNNGGEEAAVSDAIYNISKQARIVAAPRHWRQYMERSWDVVSPPPDILLPESAAERKNWRRWIKEGWEQGVSQADDTFQADLNRMTADFEGMVRYRNLLAQGKVSAPYAVMVDRGVTGGGAQMRVGDRAVKISGPSQLINRGDTWQPPERQ